MTTSAKTITIGGVSSTSKVDAMGKTENGKTGYISTWFLKF